MATSVNSHRATTWMILGGIAIAAAILVWLSPAEQTLGQGVKIVYVHVALTQVATVGLYLAGLLGLGVALSESRDLLGWMRTTGHVALGWFAAGFVMSVMAQRISWGGIAWREPRVLAAMNVLAAALIVQIAGGWLPWGRVRGLLSTALAIFLLWSNLNAQSVLHPGAAIRTSPSLVIRASFFGLLGLCFMGAAWLIWRLHQSEIRDRQSGAMKSPIIQ